MKEFRGIRAIWRRELIRYSRERSRILTSIASPLLWLVVFSSGFSAFTIGSGVEYQTFLFPGILGMTILFSSLFFGVSVVWDRQFGFLKETLVAPISRISIFFGKALGGSTIGMIQGTIFLFLGGLFGIGLSIPNVLLVLPILFLISLIIVSTGLFIGSHMESFEGFNLVMTFFTLPMFFLSGALFPLNNLPAFLLPLTYINPLAFGVDALRALLIGTSQYSLGMNILVLLAFASLTIYAGAWAFKRQK
ncbi:ABC transporter permease [Candidatus Micrarchaeota archaeon]|nr:ABC transporter permease [Candidatus Micrarchaeota archaeon]